MARNLQIQIADPCHEDWDQMTPAEQGRYCGSCQKQVVDFSNMSDYQLAAFFKKPSNGSVCGRFFNDQLDRDLEIPRKRIPWVRYFFQFALPAFLMSAKASAQGKVKVRNADIVATPSERMMLGQISIPQKNISTVQKIIVNGKVIDENNQPVSFASVMVKGTLFGVSADSSGVFKMEMLLPQKNFVLEVSSVGYDSKEITISKETDPMEDLVILLSGRILAEVMLPSSGARLVKGYTNVVMGGISVGRCVKKPEGMHEIIPVAKTPEPTLPMIKVYPNPVLSGTAINIGCEKLEEGYYTFRFLNQAGQQISASQIWIDKEARLMNLEIPAVVPGNYLLILTNKESGKKFTEKIVVQ